MMVMTRREKGQAGADVVFASSIFFNLNWGRLGHLFDPYDLYIAL